MTHSCRLCNKRYSHYLNVGSIVCPECNTNDRYNVNMQILNKLIQLVGEHHHLRFEQLLIDYLDDLQYNAESIETLDAIKRREALIRATTRTQQIESENILLEELNNFDDMHARIAANKDFENNEMHKLEMETRHVVCSCEVCK